MTFSKYLILSITAISLQQITIFNLIIVRKNDILTEIIGLYTRNEQFFGYCDAAFCARLVLEIAGNIGKI